MSMNDQGLFDDVWIKGCINSMTTSHFDLDQGGLPSEMMLLMNDGNYFPNSQDVAPLAEYITNDSQSNSGFNLDQVATTEVDADTSQVFVDISDTIIPHHENIPAHVNWLGNYNFNIIFDPQMEKTTKSTTWTYSESLDKLFVVTGKAVDVKFQLGSSPPPGCIIRTLPIFTKPEHVNDTVRRCPNHCLPAESANDGHPAPEHLVRCESKNSVYQECSASGRLSVIVPYEAPQVGTNCSTYLFKFMCYSSCVGGLNRRPIQLIFTLEKNGEILGRRSLKVRICACPGRDRKAEEKRKFGARSLSRQSSITKASAAESYCAGSTKRKRDDDVYTLTVRGRENYDILTKIAEGLEIRSETSSEKLDEKRSERQSRFLGDALARHSSGSAKPVTLTSATNAQGSLSQETLNAIRLCVVPKEADGIVLKRSKLSLDNIVSSSNATGIGPSLGMESISCWLHSIGMEYYNEHLKNCGFTTVRQLKSGNMDNVLAEMNIPQEHRRIMCESLMPGESEQFSSQGGQVSVCEPSSSCDSSTLTRLKKKGSVVSCIRVTRKPNAVPR